MKNLILTIHITEQDGFERDKQIITQGIPFPEGVIFDPSLLISDDENNLPIPLSATPLSTWKDGSVKWMLFDFQLSIESFGATKINLYQTKEGMLSGIVEKDILELVETKEKLIIKTNKAVFELSTSNFYLFKQIYYNDIKILNQTPSFFCLTNSRGMKLTPVISKWRVETRNNLRIVLLFEGRFDSGKNPLDFKCRIHFYPDSMARLDFSISNPLPARHLGGVWDLGDKNSYLFKCLYFDLNLSGQESLVAYSVDPSDGQNQTKGDFSIYQDSSGGENWKSKNHVNRNGKVPLTFKGYRVKKNQEVISQGNRATPIVGITNNNIGLCASIKQFWQNFPKSIEVKKNTLRLGLFPEEFNDLFELQGGEKKSHTIYLSPFKSPLETNVMKWVHHPLKVDISPEWFYSSKACPRPVPLKSEGDDEIFQNYQNLIDVAIKGNQSFEKRREIIDEFGWRNFGDIYADHESIFQNGPGQFISHYNNQYDVIKGGIIQFMRSGDHAWFRMSDELAGHVSDIDIYHTVYDRFQYNHGLFWHTDHHLDAATSTHRTISKKHMEFKDPRYVGGGPSYEHNYTTGLLYHYWMTGEERSKESVLELAEYVLNGIDGPDTLMELLYNKVKENIGSLSKKLKKGVSDYQGVYGFDGPGRGSGNSLNVLIDAYALTKEKKYLLYAEKLIRCCISPYDDISSRSLLNSEIRWMYTIFLQSLAKYLDIKSESDHFDDAFQFAKQSLQNYSEWMLENEYPYLEKPEILEFPNETWAAQDIRKADILAHASQYVSEPLKTKLKLKSRFFLESSLEQLKTFETSFFVRPVAILMTNGMLSFDVIISSSNNALVENSDFDVLKIKPSSKESTSIVFSLVRHFSKISVKKEIKWIKQRIDSRKNLD